MKLKKKYLLAFAFLLAFIDIISKVDAVEQLPDNGAIIKEAQIIETKTGTGPFDEDDEPGNDSSENNNIVRSFDQITWTLDNTMDINNKEQESYTGGKIYFEATLDSDDLSAEEIQWDLSSMAWVENAELSEDKMTLKGSYTLKSTSITVPGKQSLVFVAKLLSAKNGSKFKPNFKVWLNGNSDSDKKEIEGEQITVSAAPKYNLYLVRNNLCETRSTFNIDGKSVTGRVYGYALVYQLYNSSTSKGLKGIEYPEGDITADLNLSFTKYNPDTGNRDDISNEVTPILYQYQLSGASSDDVMIADRPLFVGNSEYTTLGDDMYPTGKATYKRSNRTETVYDSGKIKMVQNGTTISTTLSDYKFDGVFPTSNYSSEGAISYLSNVGCFGSTYFQVLIPDWDKYDETSDYRLEIKDSNFSANSTSGINTTKQMNEDDDKRAVTYYKYKKGNYYTRVTIDKRDGKYSNGAVHSTWDSGDGTAFHGQELYINSVLSQTETNDYEANMRAINDFYKFDGNCYQPVLLPDGRKYRNDSTQMTFKMWYVTKKDGSNWTSQDEMNETLIEDCEVYENLDDIPKEKLCIGVYYESVDGGVITSRDTYLRLPVVIKDDAKIGTTYGITQAITYWKDPIDRNVYTVTNVISDENITWPSGSVYDIASKGNTRKYVKTEYDTSGVQIAGTHAGGSAYGNTILVIGAEQSIEIAPVEKATDNKKVNYDISKNEYDVTYKIQPKLTSSYENSDVTDVSMTVDAILPAGLKYVANSSNVGEPEITYNSDGTTNLRWTLTNCEVNGVINPVYFDAHIDETSANSVQYNVTAKMLADFYKVGSTPEAKRTATTTIQIINLSSHRLYKTVETPVIERNGEIHYVVSYKNNTDEQITDFQLLDILPYNGDGRGTTFNGTYTLSKLIVTQKDSQDKLLSNDNLTISYTSDEGIRGTVKSKDINLGDGWTKATTEDINQAATGYVVKGTIQSQETFENRFK